jgi:hypothetical protein
MTVVYSSHPMNESEQTSANRSGVVNTLAVAGFIALIALGVWLAAYATRFVPGVVGGIGAAAVSLGSVFNPAPDNSLSVVPNSTSTASTTISFGDVTASSTPQATTTTPAPTPKPTPKPTPAPGTPSTGTYPIGGTTAPVTLSGLPDFTATITAVGYLATTSAESFVASATVPNGSRPAVKFTIKNIGTNVTGLWRFSASIPTQTAYIFQSQPQQTLGPGDSIDYTLGFDQANRGSNQTISVTANFDNAVAETSTNNNSASASVTILGS